MARKVTVVGAGNVGATCAQRIVEKDLADVVLLDIVDGMPQGKALDVMESAPVEGFGCSIVGTSEYAETADSDVVVITAGLARKPGMSRDDLLQKNAEIVGGIAEQIVKYSPECIIIIVTNPLDVMSYLVQKKTGLPAERVIGMAGVLDTARYRYFVAEKLRCKPSDVTAMVLGGHGDTMVPVVGQTVVNGKCVTELLDESVVEQLVERTRKGGAEVVALLKTGSAYYAPSSSAVEMVKAILNDEKKTLPCCALLSGEYGLDDIYFGVPVVLGKKGIERIVEITLSESEKEMMKVSADNVKGNISKLTV